MYEGEFLWIEIRIFAYVANSFLFYMIKDSDVYCCLLLFFFSFFSSVFLIHFFLRWEYHGMSDVLEPQKVH